MEKKQHGDTKSVYGILSFITGFSSLLLWNCFTSQMLMSVSYSKEDVNRTALTSRDHFRALVLKDTLFQQTMSTAQVSRKTVH